MCPSANTVVEDIPSKDLRASIDNIKKHNKNVIAVLLSKVGTKVQIAVGISDTLVERVSAVDLVKILSSKTGGRGGGGRPDFAQGGGTLPEQSEEALLHLKLYLDSNLSGN